MLYCIVYRIFVFFFKQKTAYEMRISDWSSDVCSSDLIRDVINVLNTLHEIENALLLPEEPVVKMWRGYEPQLCWYGMRVCEQIEYRGIFEVEPSKKEIGRASCRERVCKHV